MNTGQRFLKVVYFSSFVIEAPVQTTIHSKMVAMMEYTPDSAGQESYILCADCGTVISSANGAGLCESSSRVCRQWVGLGLTLLAGVGCLRNTVDITEGIPKEATLNFCRGCERFLSPPQSWVHAQPESRELLGKLISRGCRGWAELIDH